MNFLAIILLAFTAVGPLSARAMLDTETDDCVWGTCGGIPCQSTAVVQTRSCDFGGGVTATQYCCSTCCGADEDEK
ncbi:hypothetical protein CY34DRAFT_694316 [Suillus luteus UH-Slu-Lm8-n1]|uniref:Uncharacterized protein n=1 Tax=Suillus luteus UH-Slu-Lm8-n1 TaxID=930992 RepID=A0A0C9Z7V3_9AGAM|nr:hypothetical protein CY34DRAFT_694316 [Suillus luteus UH-Slu-Lm8-n1]